MVQLLQRLRQHIAAIASAARTTTTTDFCHNITLPSTQQTNEGYRGLRKKRPSLMLVDAGPTPGPNFKVRGVRRGGVQVVSKKTPTYANRGLREWVNIEIGGAGGALAPSCECCRWAFFSKTPESIMYIITLVVAVTLLVTLPTAPSSAAFRLKLRFGPQTLRTPPPPAAPAFARNGSAHVQRRA